MIEHVFLPEINLDKKYLPAYGQYLKEWREEAIEKADDGDVSISICNQGVLIDLVLDGKVSHDWLGIMNEFLTDEEVPLAYSTEYARRLYKFENQYKQSTIHSIYTRWWIENLISESVDHQRYATLILRRKQSDGLIYDREVSETILRHRMKTELTMSAAMSAEILKSANMLTESFAIELATNIVCSKKCPTLGYISMEYFRLRTLESLGHVDLFPVNIEEHIRDNEANLVVGWCDFSMSSKVDAYMGTAKRTSRDKPIHSPLIACFISRLVKIINTDNAKKEIAERMSNYSAHLNKNPMDIPAFQMRDVPIPFGASITPLEVICANNLIS
jgi:hypothetical protein